MKNETKTFLGGLSFKTFQNKMVSVLEDVSESKTSGK